MKTTTAPLDRPGRADDMERVDRSGWCTCGKSQDPTDEVYYEVPGTGIHGWICIHCRKITQTG